MRPSEFPFRKGTRSGPKLTLYGIPFPRVIPMRLLPVEKRVVANTALVAWSYFGTKASDYIPIMNVQNQKKCSTLQTIEQLYILEKQIYI